MGKTIVATLIAAAAFAVGSEARAAGWGLHSGETMPTNQNMVYSEVGWPDLSLGIQHGMSETWDVGARLSIIYGVENTTWTQVGLGLRAPIRVNLTNSASMSAFFHIDPGIKFDAFSPVLFGLQFPLGAEVGIHLNPDATLQFGLDLNCNLNVTQRVFFAIPILAGPGFEYKVNPNLAVGLNTRFGASIITSGGFTPTDFGLVVQAGFAYKL